jgi:hypothetical protein
VNERITKLGWAVVIVISFAALFAFAVVTVVAPPPNPGFGSSAAVLSVITATAIGIERVLEIGWTLIGQIDSKWPKRGATAVTMYLDSLDAEIEPFVTRAAATLEEIRNRADAAGQAKDMVFDQIPRIERLVAQANAAVKELGTKAPDSARVELLAATITQIGVAIEQTAALVTDVDEKLATPAYDAVVRGLESASAFVGGFNDNPGRRLISIVAGVIIGLGVAGFLGLDVFHAILTDNASVALVDVAKLGWGTAITGVVMGLGANPTHEVIRAIQEYKKKTKR